jgi:hypothetical protein
MHRDAIENHMGLDTAIPGCKLGNKSTHGCNSGGVLPDGLDQGPENAEEAIGLLRHASRNIAKVSCEDIGDPSEKMQGQRERSGGNNKVGVDDIRLPSPAKRPCRKKGSDQIKRHFKNAAGVLLFTIRFGTKNRNSTNLGFARQVPQPS